MPRRISYTGMRANLGRVFDEVAESRQPYVVERRNGKNVALISERELASILETVHLLRSSKNAARLTRAMNRARRHRTKPSTVAELRRSLKLEAKKA